MFVPHVEHMNHSLLVGNVLSIVVVPTKHHACYADDHDGDHDDSYPHVQVALHTMPVVAGFINSDKICVIAIVPLWLPICYLLLVSFEEPS